MEQKTLSISEISQYTGIPKRTLYDMVKDGRFDIDPIPRVSPKRWNIEDVDTWRGVKNEPTPI